MACVVDDRTSQYSFVSIVRHTRVATSKSKVKKANKIRRDQRDNDCQAGQDRGGQLRASHSIDWTDILWKHSESRK